MTSGWREERSGRSRSVPPSTARRSAFSSGPCASSGFRPLDLVRAPIFRLLAIERHEVIDALGELNRLDAIRFRMQGDVVELDIEEVA